ncbi:hypothetical protein HDU76_012642 [Blyttiomyces sp. JEL0837]|nr:hypothetical protein HDU76_012642 [Blyttiomyces sp. JEL0837]
MENAQTIIRNNQAQLARAQKEIESMSRGISTLTDLRKRLAVVVTQIFELDTRYPCERKLTKKVQSDIKELQVIAQHRYNHFAGDQQINEHIGNASIAPITLAIPYANYLKAVYESIWYYKDSNATYVPPAFDGVNILIRRIEETKAINKQEFSERYSKLIEDVKSLHAHRLLILDATPGLISSHHASSSSSSSSSQVTDATNSGLSYQPENVTSCSSIDCHKLSNLFRIDFAVAEFVASNAKPVTALEIADCLGIFLEDMEVSKVLDALKLALFDFDELETPFADRPSFWLQRHSFTTSSSSSSTSPQPQPPTPTKWWHKHASFLKSAPASHLTSFLILHELTAIIPLPIIYYGLSTTGLQIPIPQQLVEDSARRIQKVMKRYGFDDGSATSSESGSEGWDAAKIEKHARVVLDIATSYALVKMMMPARLAVSAALTPWFARVAVVPMRDFIKKRMGSK